MTALIGVLCITRAAEECNAKTAAGNIEHIERLADAARHLSVPSGIGAENWHVRRVHALNISDPRAAHRREKLLTSACKINQTLSRSCPA
jgi:hypothetical protein